MGNPSVAHDNPLTQVLWFVQKGDVLSVEAWLTDEKNDRADVPPNVMLHTAVRDGNRAMIKMLLNNNVDVNATDKLGNTALHKALRNWDRKRTIGWADDVLDMLLAHGADPNRRNVKGKTPLHLAAEASSKDQVLNAAPNNIRIQHKNENALFRLLEHGADPNAQDDKGEIPLLQAARWGSLNKVKRLITAGADAKRAGPSGQCALHGAAAAHAPTVIRCLLENGAEIGAQDHRGNTALHSVFKSRRVGNQTKELETMHALIGAGADVNACNHDDQTPAVLAVKRLRDAALADLLNAGAVFGKDNGRLDDVFATLQHQGSNPLDQNEKAIVQNMLWAMEGLWLRRGAPTTVPGLPPPTVRL